MIRRCSNPKAQNYKWYGGRGIKVCERWRLFENFYADMGQRDPGMTIERINVDEDYGPRNCRWTAATVQARNRRLPVTNTSGYRGVFKNRRRWKAAINVQGEIHYLGNFVSKVDAARAYNNAVIKYFGNDAQRNIIEDSPAA